MASPERELALIRRIAQRDREAFAELYRLYHRRLVSFLLRFTRRMDLVEEIYNDVMLVVWQKAGGFRGQSRVSTWVLGIAYRKALKALKRQQSRPEELPIEDVVLVDGERPDQVAGRRQLRERLQAAMSHLSPEHRAVVELTYYHGYSYPEIARIVGCPPNTVKTRMFHARRRLRRILPRLESVAAVRRRNGEVRS